MLIQSLQQQQAAINKLQLQMTAFMAAYAPPTNYPSNNTNPPTQQYPTPQYSQPPSVAPRQDHVFSNYAGPNNTNSTSADKPNAKKPKSTAKKSANSNFNSFPPSMSFNNSLTLNNFVPLSPPMEEDCVNQFLIDDYPLIDHNDSSSLLLGPTLNSRNHLEPDHAAVLERIFSGNARFGPPN